MATTNGVATHGGASLKPKQIEEEAHHISNGEVPVNNWAQAGPAAFDFRSEICRRFLHISNASDNFKAT